MIYFAYLVFSLAVMVVELSRKKRFLLDYLTYFNVIFVISYIITPLLLLSYSNQSVYARLLDEIFLLSVISYVSVLVGWVLGGASARRYSEFDDGKIVKTICRYTAFIAVIAVVYIIGKGGVISLLASGALVRYGYEEATETAFDFLQNVYSAAEVVAYTLFAMMLSDRYKRYYRLICWSYLLVFLLYALYILSTSSRGAIANALLVHFIILIYFRGGSLVAMVPLLSLLLVLTLFGKQFFFAFASFLIGENFIDAFGALDEVRNAEVYINPLIEKVMKEFSHSTDSLVAALSDGGMIGYTYFSDFFLSVLRIIPQRIMTHFVELPATISTVNTSVLIGVKVASIPPGLMAHFYYSLGMVGIIAGFLTYGFIGRKINDRIANAVLGNDVIYAVYAHTALTFGFFVSNGDPNVYFYSILWPVIVYYSLSRSRIRPRRRDFTASVIDGTNARHKMPELR
jgi:hypothetical protein